ncbi:MAG TPA: ABC transporter permease subunit [Bacillota bacterium]|nr:ABC transporter permease subunit [Bacillota bacterium]
MNSAFFTKKELKEYFKTPKFIILLIVFIFFSILSPLTARYMNELIAALSPDLQITLPDPNFQEAWVQFYKNMTSLCLIVLLIIMTGTVAQEKNKGSIMLVLTKKVSRFNFLSSKFFAGALVFTIIFIVGALINILYTYLLFDAFAYTGLYLSLVMIWLNGLFYIALAILVSVISKTPTIAALLGFVGYAIFNLLNISESIQRFNPAGATSLVNSILAGTSTDFSNWLCLASTIIGTLIMLLGSYLIFKKQEI